MGSVFDGYPFSNTHQLNLDWIIAQIKKVEPALEELKTTLENLEDISAIVDEAKNAAEKASAAAENAADATEKINSATVNDIPLVDNPVLKASNVGAVPDSATINGLKVVDNPVLSASNVGAAPAGFGLGAASPFREIATASVLDQFNLNGSYAIRCVSPLMVAGVSIEWFTIRVTNWDAETLVHELYINGQSTILRRICDHNSWSDWEWVNPPMVTGVEYRTTERWNSAAVYVKRISFGVLPAAGSSNVPTEISGSLVNLTATFHSAGSIEPYPIMSGTGPKCLSWINDDCSILYTQAIVDCSGYTGEFVIKYTKN